MSILSISLGLIVDSALVETPVTPPPLVRLLLLYSMKPSITYNGSLPKLNELPPRILILAVAPGCPELEETATPATAPCNKLSKEGVVRSKASFGTDATEPVTSFRFWVP